MPWDSEMERGETGSFVMAKWKVIATIPGLEQGFANAECVL